MKPFLTIIASLFLSSTYSQNVGIGTSTPGFPLNFSNTLGDKISLYGNSGNHYGFGIQGGLLQVHSDAAAANIAFGYGSSSSFTERMRIINNGGDGLSLNGRITLRNGTSPVDPAYGSGVWMYNANNTGLLGFMGVQNNQNIGFYGGPLNNGWGFVYDAINSRVGIGTSTPTASLMLATNLNPQLHIRQTNTVDYSRIRMQTGTSRYWDIAGYNDGATLASERLNFFNSETGDILSLTGSGFVGIGTNNPISPLSFAGTLGRKITLFPGGAGTVGMGVYANEFRIHTDYEPADITFGFEDNANVFTERMRIKGNGNVGIGTNNPTAPLGFPPQLGKKIIFYPAQFGNVGIGVYGNELRIHTDDFPADITFGYELTNGFFSERFRVKGNGAVAFNGSSGSAGQLLKTNGSGVPPQWISMSDIIKTEVMTQQGTVLVQGVATDITNSVINVNAPATGKIILWIHTSTVFPCINPLDACSGTWQMQIIFNNSLYKTAFIQVQSQVIQPDYDQTVGPIVIPVGAGIQSIRFRGVNLTTLPVITTQVSAYAQFFPD